MNCFCIKSKLYIFVLAFSYGYDANQLIYYLTIYHLLFNTTVILLTD